jgi:hypothetical protein
MLALVAAGLVSLGVVPAGVSFVAAAAKSSGSPAAIAPLTGITWKSKIWHGEAVLIELEVPDVNARTGWSISCDHWTPSSQPLDDGPACSNRQDVTGRQQHHYTKQNAITFKNLGWVLTAGDTAVFIKPGRHGKLGRFVALQDAGAKGVVIAFTGCVTAHDLKKRAPCPATAPPPKSVVTTTGTSSVKAVASTTTATSPGQQTPTGTTSTSTTTSGSISTNITFLTTAATSPATSTTASLTSTATTTTNTSTATQQFFETTGPNSTVATWSDYQNAGGEPGWDIDPSTTVQVGCKVTGLAVGGDKDTWWYRITSYPWLGSFYASADAFYNNGQTTGDFSQTPQVDPAVPSC